MKKNNILAMLFSVTLVSTVFSGNNEVFGNYFRKSILDAHQAYEEAGSLSDYYQSWIAFINESASESFFWHFLLQKFEDGKLGLMPEQIEDELNSSDSLNRELGLYLLNNVSKDVDAKGFDQNRFLDVCIQKTLDDDLNVRRLSFYVINNFFRTFACDEKVKIDFFNKVVSPALEDSDIFIKGYAIELLSLLKKNSFTKEDFDSVVSNLKSKERNIQLSALRALLILISNGNTLSDDYSDRAYSILKMAKKYFISNDIEDLSDGRFLFSGLIKNSLYATSILDFIDDFFETNEFLHDSNMFKQSVVLSLYGDLLLGLDFYDEETKNKVIESAKKNLVSRIDSENPIMKESILFVYRGLVAWDQELEAASEIVKACINDSDATVKSAAVELLISLVEKDKCIEFANEIAKQFISASEANLHMYGLKIRYALAVQGYFLPEALDDIKAISEKTTSVVVSPFALKVAKELFFRDYDLPGITNFAEQSIVQLDSLQDQCFPTVKNMLLPLIELCSILSYDDFCPKNIVHLLKTILDESCFCVKVAEETNYLVDDLIYKKLMIPEMKMFAEDYFKEGRLNLLANMESFIELIEDSDCLDKIVDYVEMLIVNSKESPKVDFLSAAMNIYSPLRALVEKGKALDLAQDFLQDMLSNIRLGDDEELEAGCINLALILSNKLISQGVDVGGVKSIIDLAFKYKENDMTVRSIYYFCYLLVAGEVFIEEALEAAELLLEINKDYAFEIVDLISSTENLSEKSLEIYSKIQELQESVE